MKCDGCRWAEWARTRSGALHPNKSGKCKRLETHPLDLRLPAAFSWNTFGRGAPVPNGGFIERGRELTDKCEFKDGSKP